MDILYVIGRGSKWQDNELRYSLRSIEKNCTNVGRIFIAGYCPSFINRNMVTFIPCEDQYETKHKNILHCIETAIEKNDISDDFLLSSDDHFYIRPTDFSNYPYYRKAKDLPDDITSKPYTRTLSATRMILRAAGLTSYNFSWHGNTHFNKTLFLEPQFEALRKLSYLMPNGCEPTCLMLNYQLSRKPFEITDREDNKMPKDTTKEAFMQCIDRECISCASSVDGSYIKTFLPLTFHDKCRYEK